MNKRLSKSEFLFAYMIIISLACLVGGFFFGAYYMKSKIAAEQAAIVEQQRLEAERERQLREQKLYSEQDFIRFYYAVYAPFLELKRVHFEKMEAWPDQDPATRKDSIKALIEAAKQTTTQLGKEVPLPTSPLLVQAHTQYQAGARAYLDGMKQLLSDQNNNALSPDEITARLALTNWFKANEQFYHSLAAWESAYVTKQPLPKELPAAVSIEQWKQLPFHYKTYLAATAMTAHNKWGGYNPEDLTARLDLLFESDDVKNLGIKDLHAAVRVLTATDAVHSGDFKEFQHKHYSSLKTPEIPLYR
ncbi:hypothetical protein KDJ56_12570 [Brevibacillus composti]|uniref:Uncharacterized protein n=1 Tax=Brevibacillus composti TaxID=2796470 RepID=A0A7T5EHR0_9BACL|nr:hypothetical protein [Brevibacillus composti]QQE72791.1 hypothetical protein JD108_12625 [Brevibacillus composti]QUO39870.1 hypothetical protein KDJ56_12570 [Brevibacillus composti]